MTVVPADATGVYPALAGYVPVERGRRVLIVLVDAALSVSTTLLLPAVLIGPALAATGSSRRVSSGALLDSLGLGSTVALVIGVGFGALTLWALLGRGARVAGLFMGAQAVDVQTGRVAGGRVLGKYLLQGLVSLVTLGIGPLIVSYVSMAEPLGRTWFDRVVGIMVVDTRRGRRPGTPAPAAARPVPRVPVESVRPIALPAATPWVPESVPAEELLRPPLVAPAAVEQVAFDPGPIESTPWSVATPGVPAADSISGPMPAFAATEIPVVVERRADSGRTEEHTVLAADPALSVGPDAPRVTLTGVGDLALAPPAVLGRNPVAPAGYPHARVIAVSDPAMTLSKTHLMVGADDGQAWVIDLHSTNGVAVTGPDGVRRRIEAGVRTPVPAPARIDFGQHHLDVVRG